MYTRDVMHVKDYHKVQNVKERKKEVNKLLIVNTSTDAKSQLLCGMSVAFNWSGCRLTVPNLG